MNINDLKNLEHIEEISQEISHVPFDEMFSERDINLKTKIYAINQYSKIMVVLIIFAFGIFGGKKVYDTYMMREIQDLQAFEQIEFYANKDDSQKDLKNIETALLGFNIDEKISVSSYLNSNFKINQALDTKKIFGVSVADGSVRYIPAEYKVDVYDIGKLMQIFPEHPENEARLYNVMAVHYEIKGDFIGAKSTYLSAMNLAPKDYLVINNIVGFAKANAGLIKNTDYPD